METVDKSKEQLIKENNQLRTRIDELEKTEVEFQNIEHRLKESQLLVKLLDNSSQPFAVGNTDGTLSKVNSAFCELTGYTEYELLNNVSWNNTLTPKKWRKYEEELLTKVITTGDSQLFEKEYIRKDGEIISVELLMHRSLDDDNNIDYVYGFITDITQRKQTEIDLQESELHYRTLFNESPIPLWEEDFSEVKKYIDKLKKNKIVDFKEYFDNNPEELREIAHLVKIIDVNNATLQLHEANSKEELLNGLESVFTEDSYIAFKQEMIAIAQGKTKYNSEGVVKTLKGKYKHVQLSWNVLPGYENSYKKVFLSSVDITESKKMAKTVLEEKNKAQQYLDIADIMLVSVDYLGIVKLINQKGCEILGYSEDEIVGQNWFDNFLPERLRKNVKAVSKKIFAGEMESAAYYENEIITKAGEERLIAWHNAIYKDDKGNIIGTLSSGEDITERKLAEEALHKSEEKYRSLIDDVLDTSSVGIFILDSEFKVAWINKATEKYFGIKKEDVIGKDKRQLINSKIKRIFEDPKYFTKKVFDTYDNNNYVENFECHIIPAKDREDRWLRHWSQPITHGLYKNGRIEQYTDITERKLAEEELAKYHDNLEILIKERTNELEEKNQELDQALKVFVGREYKINELQEKIRALEKD